MIMLRRMSLAALVIVLALIAASCGGGNETSGTTEGTVPPLESTTTEAMEETTTTAAEETATTEAVAVFDVAAAVAEFESTIPDGWMNVGDITAFKDAAEASGALVIDVRQPEEYAEGHIPGAINIPLRELAANADKIPTDTQVFVHCASGFRAGLAVSALRILGYDNALSFSGSYNAWVEAGEEVSTDAVEAEVVGDPGFAPELVAAVDAYLSNIPDGWGTAGDVEAVKAAIEAGAFVLDVRSPEEYAEGHIEGAVNIPLRTVAANVDQIPTDVAVVVHCKSGLRASLAMPVLGVLGYDNAKAFTGGSDAWVGAGEPVVTG